MNPADITHLASHRAIVPHGERSLAAEAAAGSEPADLGRVPGLSVVVPFFNEEESLAEVCRELVDVLAGDFGDDWELVLVDDGSTDRTPELLEELVAENPRFRGIHLVPNSGQSAALQAGFQVARGEVIATLDGDGQNDPQDIARLLQAMAERDIDMMCGIRTRRADNFVRRASSRIANRVRSAVLGDRITDVGCSLRVFRRDCLRRVPFFRNAHRFFPALFMMSGFSVAETPVSHRPRMRGTSKYGGGINSRLWVGLADLAGVYWLRKRALDYRVDGARK